MKTSYIPKNKRKKILLLGDDLRMHSGVATMLREIVTKTSNHFNWVQLAGAINHPEQGKKFDLSQATRDMTKVPDANVKLYPVDGYGSDQMLFAVMQAEKPDAIMHFTDPRFWGWLYAIEKQVRSKIPLTYLHIWDDLPYPMWNRPFYQSCDALFAISKQSNNIAKHVLGAENCFSLDEVENQPV